MTIDDGQPPRPKGPTRIIRADDYDVVVVMPEELARLEALKRQGAGTGPADPTGGKPTGPAPEA